jgi:hypothetical protein
VFRFQRPLLKSNLLAAEQGHNASLCDLVSCNNLQYVRDKFHFTTFIHEPIIWSNLFPSGLIHQCQQDGHKAFSPNSYLMVRTASLLSFFVSFCLSFFLSFSTFSYLVGPPTWYASLNATEVGILISGFDWVVAYLTTLTVSRRYSVGRYNEWLMMGKDLERKRLWLKRGTSQVFTWKEYGKPWRTEDRWCSGRE